MDFPEGSIYRIHNRKLFQNKLYHLLCCNITTAKKKLLSGSKTNSVKFSFFNWMSSSFLGFFSYTKWEKYQCLKISYAMLFEHSYSQDFSGFIVNVCTLWNKRRLGKEVWVMDSLSYTPCSLPVSVSDCSNNHLSNIMIKSASGVKHFTVGITSERYYGCDCTKCDSLSQAH